MEVAVLVAKEGQPVTWVTPLGLPVMQPYRRNSGFQVRIEAEVESCAFDGPKRSGTSPRPQQFIFDCATIF